MNIWPFTLLCNENFPALAHNIGLACLTILIPVAIAIFSSDREFKELDNHVILDHVIKAKTLLIACALVFVPVLFWDSSSVDWRFFEVLFWTIGVWILVRILFLSYKWLKGNKFPLRFDFLRTLANNSDMEESWRSVWGSSDLSSQTEKEFFDIFASRIDELLKP